MDFYRAAPSNVRVRELRQSKAIVLRVGETVLVPVVGGGEIHLLHPDSSEAEIRKQNPHLAEDTIKAFLSLRTRVLAKDGQTPDSATDDLLESINRSRYWISQFRSAASALSQSETDKTNELKSLDEARDVWLSRFSAKASLKDVLRIIETPHIQMERGKARRVLARRLESILLNRGVKAQRNEVRQYLSMFPSGIMKTLREDSRDHFEYWRRASDIANTIDEQIRRTLYAVDAGDSPYIVSEYLSYANLVRYYEIIRIISDADGIIDNILSRFQRVYEEYYGVMGSVLGDSRAFGIAALVEGYDRSGFREILRGFAPGGSDVLGTELPYEMQLIHDVAECYKRFLIIARIVRSLPAGLSDDEILFDGIDPKLVRAVRLSAKRGTSDPLRQLFAASPELEWLAQWELTESDSGAGA